MEASAQTDVVIYDAFHNSPLHSELAAFVFPIEMVYATVEVKALLNATELKNTLENISYTRNLAMHKTYVTYSSVPVRPDRPGDLVGAEQEFSFQLAPRSYLFAYDSTWKTEDGFKDAVIDALSCNPQAHLHGMAILGENQNWFVSQKPHQTPPQANFFRGNALLHLMNAMIRQVASFQMWPASVSRYLNL
jgi:hypothetical protein